MADSPPRPSKKPGRRRMLLVLGALGLVVVGYFVLTFFQVVAASHTDDAAGADTPAAQAIIVLGAAQYDGTPSPVLRARLSHALALYRRGLAPVLVVTGGRQPGDRFTEATAGYDFLRKHGVPDAAILREVHGRTTWESLDSAATFLHAQHIRDVLLVSDSYHNKRVLGIAAQVGLHARVSPSDEPMASATRTRALVRETVAVGIGRVIGYRVLDHR